MKKCWDLILKGSPEITGYLKSKTGIDYNHATGAGKDAYIKAAKELQQEILKSLNNVYADIGVEGYKNISSPKIKNDASTQTSEQQQGGLQQGSITEHARTEQAGSEGKATSAENSNSDQRGEGGQEKINQGTGADKKAPTSDVSGVSLKGNEDVVKQEIDREFENIDAAIEGSNIDGSGKFEGRTTDELLEDRKKLQDNPAIYFGEQMWRMFDYIKDKNVKGEDRQHVEQLYSEYEKIFNSIRGLTDKKLNDAAQDLYGKNYNKLNYEDRNAAHYEADSRLDLKTPSPTVEQVNKTENKKSEKRNVIAKKVYKDIGEIDAPSDVRGLALEYLAGGGKINESSINEIAGTVKRATLNTGAKEKLSSEVKARDYVSKDSPTITEAAHSIWDNLPKELQSQITDRDIINELNDVVRTHNTRLNAALEFRDRYILKEAESNLTSSEAKDIDEDLKNQAVQYINDLPEDQQKDLLKVIQKYQNQYGIIDWEQLEKDTNGFDADILSLPLETSNALDAIIQKNIKSGQSELSNTPAKSSGQKEGITEEEIASAKSVFDKAARDLKSAEDKLSQKQATQTGMFGAAQKEMFGVNRDEAKSILDPLRQKVKEAKAELESLQTEFDNQSNDQPSLFSIKDTGDNNLEPGAAVIKDYMDKGYSDLKLIQDSVAKQLGDDSPELRQQVKEAFEYYHKKYIPEEIHTAIVNRVKETFGKLLGSGVKVYKNEAELMKAAEQYTNPQFNNFQIIGEKAKLNKSVRDNLSVAREMEAAGKSSKEIYLATGWERGAENTDKGKGKWRYEIDDRVMSLDKSKFDYLNSAKLEDIYDNKELYKLYPDLKDVTVAIDEAIPFRSGQWDAEANEIKLGGDLKKLSPKDLEKIIQLNSVLLHEIQHAIQDKEGFAKGGNKSMFEDNAFSALRANKSYRQQLDFLKEAKEKGIVKDGFIWHQGIGFDLKTLDKTIKEAQVKFDNTGGKELSNANGSPLDIYKRLAGEVEARNVQWRSMYTPEERELTPISETEDVHRDDQIKYFDDGVQNQVDVFHGSPHSFDKFSSDKIGTGEGNQAFGHGLYFTSIKGIAEGYAKSLSNKNVKYKGEPIKYFSSLTFLSEHPEIEAAGRDVLKQYPNNTTVDSFNHNPLPILNDALGLLKYQPKTTLESMVKTGKVHFDKYGYYTYEDISAALALKLSDIGVTTDGVKNLYKVTLHEGKTPEQYDWLQWDKPATSKQFDKIEAQAKKEGIDLTVDYYTGEKIPFRDYYEKDSDKKHGQQVGHMAYTGLVKILGTEKAASDFLLRAGVDGIKYPAESLARGRTSDNARGSNYVVFDDKAVTVKEKIQFMKTPEGDVMGFTAPDGSIHLNGEKYNSNTPLHEAGHLFLKWAEKYRPDIHKTGMDLTNNSAYLKNVKSDKNYIQQADDAGLTGQAREDFFRNEALASAIGDKGEKFVTDARKQNFKEWLNNLWRNIKEHFGIRDLTPRQLQNLTLDEFSKKVAADILSGKQLETPEGKPRIKVAARTEVIGEKPPEQLPEPESINISHARLDEVAKELGLDVYEKDPVTVAEWNEEADRRIANGEIPALLGKMENERMPYMPSASEQVMIAKYAAGLKADYNITRSDAVLNEFRRVQQLSNIVGGRLVAQSLRARKEDVTVHALDGGILSAMAAKMDARQTDALTDMQKAEVEQLVKNYEERTKVAEEKVTAMEAKMAEIEAKKTLFKTAKRATGKIKTSDDYVKERQSLKEKLRLQIEEINPKPVDEKTDVQGNGAPQNLYQIRSYSSMPTPEEIKVTNKIAKTIGEIIKSHVEEVGSNLPEVTRRVLDEVKDILPDVEAKDIYDIIDGKYNAPQKTLTQLQTDLRDLKSEVDIVNKIIDIENGVPKTEKQKQQKNERLTELRKQLKDLKKETGYDDLTKLKSLKTANENKLKQINEDIANKKFDRIKPLSIFDNKDLQRRFPEEYKSALDAIKAREDAKHDFDIAVLRDQQSKRDWKQKTSDFLGKASGTLKAVVTGVDDSAVAIQTYVALLVRPGVGAIALREHLLQGASQKKFDRWLTELHNSSDWDFIKKSGLSVTEPSSLKELEKEEVFSNRFHGTIKIKGKEYKLLDVPLKPFERAFTTLGNVTRVVAFRNIAAKYIKEGNTFENNPELFKSLAQRLNTETGRGAENEFIRNSAKLVTLGIWSPKLMASKFNILGVSDIFGAVTGGKAGTKGYYAQLHPRERIEAAKDVAQFVATVVALSYLGAYAFGADVDDDPLSPTFMDIKFPNGKSINLTGGFSGYFRTICEVALGKKSDPQTGQVKDVSRTGLVLRFLRGKTPPLTGAIINAAEGKNFMGQKTTVLDEAKNVLLPISAKGIVEQIKNDGAGAFLTGLPTFLGFNVKDKKDFSFDNLTEEERKDPTYKTFIDKGVYFPNYDPAKIETKEVNGKVVEHLKDLPQPQQEQYISTHKRYYKEELGKLKNNTYKVYRSQSGAVHIQGNNTDESGMRRVRFEDLTNDEVKYLEGNLTGRATKHTKKVLHYSE